MTHHSEESLHVRAPHPDDESEGSTEAYAHPLEGEDPVARFTVPQLPGLPSIRVVLRAFRQARDHRSGVVVVAPMGYGKSEAVHAAFARHAEKQRQRSLANPKHRRTRVVYVNLRTSKTKKQLVLHLLQQATPGRALKSRLPGGAPMSDDQLREMLYNTYRAQNVVMLVIDDAQRLSPAGLEFARDLIATKESDPYRIVRGRTGDEIPAVGVGVLLIGTPELLPRLVATGETHGNGRWQFTHTVGALDPHQVARVYESIFPVFAAHVETIGRSEWDGFVATHVTLGRILPIRALTTHAREYFAAMYDKTRGRYAERESLPFDRVEFLRTLRASLWESAPEARVEGGRLADLQGQNEVDE